MLAYLNRLSDLCWTLARESEDGYLPAREEGKRLTAMTVAIEGAATCPGDVRVRAEAVLAGLVAPDGSPLADAPFAAMQGFTGAVG